MGITNKQRGYQVLSGLGAWQDVPFNPANFSGQGGMAWAVVSAPFQNRFSRVGNTVTWSVVIAAGSTLTGTAGTQLTLTAPTKSKGYAQGNGKMTNQAPPAPVIVGMSPNPPNPGYGTITLPASAAFTLGSLVLYFTITYEVEP